MWSPAGPRISRNPLTMRTCSAHVMDLRFQTRVSVQMREDELGAVRRSTNMNHKLYIITTFVIQFWFFQHLQHNKFFLFLKWHFGIGSVARTLRLRATAEETIVHGVRKYAGQPIKDYRKAVYICIVSFVSSFEIRLRHGIYAPWIPSLASLHSSIRK